MLDGRILVDAHVHAPRLPTLRPAWVAWAEEFGRAHPWPDLYDAEGAPVPELMDAHFEAEGADAVLLFSEYSPKATGIQPIEDYLPLAKHNPRRFRPVANVNPHRSPRRSRGRSASAPSRSSCTRCTAASRAATPRSTRRTRRAASSASR
jgi:hypothetical protein